MLAQYSIPFSVALALYRDPVDPRSFDDGVVHDRAILDMSSRIKMPIVPGQDRRNLTAAVTVRLKDGREFSRTVSSFKGTPERPLARPELKEKFMMLAKRLDPTRNRAAVRPHPEHREREDGRLAQRVSRSVKSRAMRADPRAQFSLALVLRSVRRTRLKGRRQAAACVAILRDAGRAGSSG